MRIAGLSADSAWSHSLWPVDPDTGRRNRRQPVTVVDDEAEVDAFFARSAAA